MINDVIWGQKVTYRRKMVKIWVHGLWGVTIHPHCPHPYIVSILRYQWVWWVGKWKLTRKIFFPKVVFNAIVKNVKILIFQKLGGRGNQTSHNYSFTRPKSSIMVSFCRILFVLHFDIKENNNYVIIDVIWGQKVTYFLIMVKIWVHGLRGVKSHLGKEYFSS